MGLASVRKGDAEQQRIVSLLHTIGAAVYVLGTRQSRGRNCPRCFTFVPNTSYGTRQTPGVSDLIVFLPPRPVRRLLLFVECKAASGRLTVEQRAFRALCEAADVPHVAGDLDAVIAWLLERGYLKDTQVPHYRLPKAARS